MDTGVMMIDDPGGAPFRGVALRSEQRLSERRWPPCATGFLDGLSDCLSA